MWVNFRWKIHLCELTHVKNTSAWINSRWTILTGMSKNIWEKSNYPKTNENKIGGFLSQQTQKFLNKNVNFTSDLDKIPDRLFLCVKSYRVVTLVRFCPVKWAILRCLLSHQQTLKTQTHRPTHHVKIVTKLYQYWLALTMHSTNRNKRRAYWWHNKTVKKHPTKNLLWHTWGSPSACTICKLYVIYGPLTNCPHIILINN